MKTPNLIAFLINYCKRNHRVFVLYFLFIFTYTCFPVCSFAQQRKFDQLILEAYPLYKAEKYSEALPLYIKAGNLIPTDTLIHIITGDIAERLRDTVLAKQEYEKYLIHGGRSLTYIRALILLNIGAKDYTSALSAVDKGLQIAPINAFVRTAKAHVLVKLGRVNEAIETANEIKRMIKFEPKNKDDLRNLGYLYIDLFRTIKDNPNLGSELLAQAKIFYTYVLSLDQNNFESNFRIGFIIYCEAYKLKESANNANILKQGDIESQAYCKFKDAIWHYDRAREINTSDVNVNKEIVRVQNILKEYESRKVSCKITSDEKPVRDTRPSIVAQNTEVNKPVRPSAAVPVPKPTNTKPIQSNVTAFSRRYALVVGNSTYQNGSSLEGLPVNDATDMAIRLRSLGFTVTLLTNTGKIALETGIGQFNQQLKNADVALFFYAGHGIESDNHNYLIPVDAKLNEPDDADLQGVDVQKLIDRMRRNSQTAFNIIILDACRDNPFKAFSRGGSRGFKQVSDLSSESNMYLAMATGWGNVADNGSGRNGIYTSALLNNLRAGEFLDDVLLRTQIEVKKQTKNRQNPQLVTEMAQEVKLKF